jgi:hypothetical protein
MGFRVSSLKNKNREDFIKIESLCVRGIYI